MADLAVRIQEMELKEAIQLAGIKAQCVELTECLKPSKLVKNAFNGILGSKSVQHTIIDTSLGLGAGWAVNKILTRNSKNIFRKMTGYALQLITTSLITKKMPEIREKITEL